MKSELIHVTPPEGWMEEEVREGYTVTKERKELWAVLLDCAAELQRVATALGIKFWADGGTSLGALREKGFVPWDDDMDFGLKRADFDKLVTEGMKLVQAPFDLSYFPNHPSGKMMMRRKGTKIFPGGSMAGIDIFPFDFVVEPGEIGKRGKIRGAWRSLINGYKTAKDSKDESLMALAQKEYLEEMQRYDSSPWLANFTIGRDAREARRVDWIGEVSNTAQFEFVTVPVPDNLEACVRMVYGEDWETPQEGQALHHIDSWEV